MAPLVRQLRAHYPYGHSRRMSSLLSNNSPRPGKKTPTSDQLAPLHDSALDRRSASSPKRLGRLVHAFEDNDHVLLNFEHDNVDRPAGFSKLWFRDACPCSECVSESSGQKRFATCDIDADPQLESCRVTNDGELALVWAKDLLTGNSHTSIYSLDFLQQVVLVKGGLHLHWRFTPERVFWAKRRLTDELDARFINYDDWMAGGDSFAKAFLDLITWGLIFVRGVPESHDAVQDIASKIGDLQLTFYGLTWDVISKPNAENVAYTNEFLCLHQDLLYWRETPRLQLLHCLKNECPGGESLFSDGLRTAWELKTSHEDIYKVLTDHAVDFHYHKHGHFYHSRRNVISTKAAYPIKVNWSPPFQAPFHQKPNALGVGNSDGLHKWREAARIFRDNLESPNNMLQYRLQPGECVLFDNQRILHGRTNFDTSAGHRHLRGGYIDTQTLSSAFVRLGELGALGALDGRPVDRWDAWE
ncbi:hypothetical protein VPNG_05805 [Cytospora leucostoma]|uniref:TauD/TfdA-like domain-containing protein n=1 Tax=Cytospora leucostoma TaxID=1230097 RepID=A0A423X0E0_9PEZI|nr:hypothetical protein VPNG_05805 [Cytospora leucostoma]